VVLLILYAVPVFDKSIFYFVLYYKLELSSDRVNCAIKLFNQANINPGFTAHFVFNIFQFVFHLLQVDIVGPLLLSASLLVLTTDSCD